MGPEEKKLMDILFGDPKRKLVNFHIFPGQKVMRGEAVTREELCAEINKALSAVERGVAMDERALEAFEDVLASLVASVSLLERGGKKAAASDKMFAMMLADYKKSIKRGRACLAARQDATADVEFTPELFTPGPFGTPKLFAGEPHEPKRKGE